MSDKYDDMARALFKKGAMSIQLLAASLRTCGQEAEKAIALLRRIEWGDPGVDSAFPRCPDCGAESELAPSAPATALTGLTGTHKPTCELAALIGKAP